MPSIRKLLALSYWGNIRIHKYQWSATACSLQCEGILWKSLNWWRIKPLLFSGTLKKPCDVSIRIHLKKINNIFHRYWKGTSLTSISRDKTKNLLALREPNLALLGTLKKKCDCTGIENRSKERILVPPRGVEPPTNGLGNRCSIHLSYGGVVFFLISVNYPSASYR